MQIEIRGTQLPGRRCVGYDNVHVGVQRKLDVIDTVAADEPSARWVLDIGIRQDHHGAIDFHGPFVHGRPGNRFLYLSWGTVDDAGAFTMFRSAKLRFVDVDTKLLHSAIDSKIRLVAHLSMTGPDGGPRCGSVVSPNIQWSI